MQREAMDNSQWIRMVFFSFSIPEGYFCKVVVRHY